MHHSDDAWIERELDLLGISIDVIRQKRLSRQAEARELVMAHTDQSGREYLLTPQAAQAWSMLNCAARQDQVMIEIVSAFRSVARQIEIWHSKLAAGLSVQSILLVSAPPGYSEHHTGCAIDINTPGCIAMEEAFDSTDAFRWLTANAHRFGFMMSYPRGNACGFAYEPWHWCYRAGGLPGAK